MGRQFGAKTTPVLEQRYADSTYWKDGKFENLIETSMSFKLKEVPGLLYKQFIDRKGRVPQRPLPWKSFNISEFEASEEPTFIWYGHSAVLMRLNGLTFLIDPMLGDNASPIGPIKTKRFSENVIDVIKTFPEIDFVMLTHDHYDHLDLASIDQLKGKVKNFFVALGVGRHLEKWGIDAARIKEFDWWDTTSVDGVEITFTPSRHFSGRGLKDRAKSLWGGWAFRTADNAIYWSGDGGYGPHFKEIGERLGPFDFGFMECGQYNQNWHAIHMFPEESVQAAIDAGVNNSMAVHWAGFALALHTWWDPIERYEEEARLKGVQTITPGMGRVIKLTDDLKERWWEPLK